MAFLFILPGAQRLYIHCISCNRWKFETLSNKVFYLKSFGYQSVLKDTISSLHRGIHGTRGEPFWGDDDDIASPSPMPLYGCKKCLYVGWAHPLFQPCATCHFFCEWPVLLLCAGTWAVRIGPENQPSGHAGIVMPLEGCVGRGRGAH